MPKVYQKEKIIVSACLLGENCRYNAETKYDGELIRWLEDKEVIAFCPEDPVFGTPRAPISVVNENGVMRLKRCSDGADVTTFIVDETKRFMALHKDVKNAILKSKSPSCGCQTTPIYCSENMDIGLGDGISASLMKKNSYTIRDEKNYKTIFKDKK